MLYEILIGTAHPVQVIGRQHRCRDDEPSQEATGSTRQRILFHITDDELRLDELFNRVGGQRGTFSTEITRMAKLGLIAVRKNGLYRYARKP